ncbi:MAG: hypothetical protein LBQ36_10090, partial [Synergistaceae bacterium]|nr:hypothetical protein [Synergistaceae bacterium]
LIDEAISELQKASVNSNWSCPERDQINNRLRNEISKKLTAIKDAGLGEISSVLVAGAAKFDEWESRGVSKEQEMSGRLKNDWGFEASKWGSGSTEKLPSTQIPNWMRAYLDIKLQELRFFGAFSGLFAGALIGSVAGAGKGAWTRATESLEKFFENQDLRDLLSVPQEAIAGASVGFGEGWKKGGYTGGKITLEAIDKIFNTNPELLKVLNSNAFNNAELGDTERKVLDQMGVLIAFLASI